jgi:hypothetical protein
LKVGFQLLRQLLKHAAVHVRRVCLKKVRCHSLSLCTSDQDLHVNTRSECTTHSYT